MLQFKQGETPLAASHPHAKIMGQTPFSSNILKKSPNTSNIFHGPSDCFGNNQGNTPPFNPKEMAIFGHTR